MTNDHLILNDEMINVGEACHQVGLKILLRVEPERVAVGTQIAREHPAIPGKMSSGFTEFASSEDYFAQHGSRGTFLWIIGE